MKQEFKDNLSRMQKEKETLGQKSVGFIFQLTKNLIQTAAALDLSIPQVKKHLNDLKIPYQAV